MTSGATGHRFRVGLTGLAAIFLVVMVAAAGMRPDRSMAPAGAHAETLSMLGVAPGARAEVVPVKSAPRPTPRTR